MEHEGIKYPCNQWDYRARTQGYLWRNNKFMHEAFNYQWGSRGCECKVLNQGIMLRIIYGQKRSFLIFCTGKVSRYVYYVLYQFAKLILS